jgi:DNA-binding phage protein
MRPPLTKIIKDELARREWSMAELDRQAGFSIGETYRFLSGERDISWSKVEAILDVLGLRICRRQWLRENA